MKNLALFSLLIGIIGIIFLGINLTLFFSHTETFLGEIANLFYRITKNLPFWVRIVLEGGIGYSFVMFLLLSPIGIFLAFKSLNSPHRKLAISAIVLNSVNLIFALFIAWLLFGLARGM
jgi:uncharacterized protein YacL